MSHQKILGISAFYHDSAAALLDNGKIVSAAQEERFTRKKHDSAFPSHAIQFCLSKENIELSDIDAVVFYDKPFIKFERLLETYLAFAPQGFSSFAKAMPIWLKEKLYLKSLLKKELTKLAKLKTSQLPALLFSEHHLSHAASCFYPSPFDQAAVLCLDGVGEWATSSAWIGNNSDLTLQWEINFPHSLGLLYSAFTYYTGFKVNSGEYKLMGLAPYGEPKYVDIILDNLIDIKDDGTFRLNMSYFDYCIGLRMTNDKFSELFGEPPRTPETALTQKHMDIASSIQYVTEQIVTRLANTLHKETNQKNLCLAGGVALNCVANGKLLKQSNFENIWIQPAAGDAGGALGAALVAWHENKPQGDKNKSSDEMFGSYLGPSFNQSEAQLQLDKYNAVYECLDENILYEKVANLLANQNVIGWFQGRMEFGPRALGNRSIIADPRSSEMQSKLNLKIKFRESFRPFAPAVLDTEASKIFDLDSSSPYMLIVAKLLKEHCKSLTDDEENLFGIDKLKINRSTLPAITHVDYSARIQTVHKSTNQEFHALLKAFHKQTNCPVLVNTSFNVRGEPIVCNPEDAYRCFMRTNMDYLVINNLLLEKSSQPAWENDTHWQSEFELD